MKRHSPRLIAAAAIFFIKKVRRETPCWSSELVSSRKAKYANAIKKFARNIVKFQIKNSGADFSTMKESLMLEILLKV
jgi:hypothetical protein